MVYRNLLISLMLKNNIKEKFKILFPFRKKSTSVGFDMILLKTLHLPKIINQSVFFL